MTEAHCHLPLPKKFVREYFPHVIASNAAQLVSLVILDDGLMQPGVLQGSIRPQSRKMAISPGIDVLAIHRGWRFSGVAVDASGAGEEGERMVRLYFDSSTADKYETAVGRKWAKKYVLQQQPVGESGDKRAILQQQQQQQQPKAQPRQDRGVGGGEQPQQAQLQSGEETSVKTSHHCQQQRNELNYKQPSLPRRQKQQLQQKQQQQTVAHPEHVDVLCTLPRVILTEAANTLPAVVSAAAAASPHVGSGSAGPAVTLMEALVIDGRAVDGGAQDLGALTVQGMLAVQGPHVLQSLDQQDAAAVATSIDGLQQLQHDQHFELLLSQPWQQQQLVHLQQQLQQQEEALAGPSVGVPVAALSDLYYHEQLQPQQQQLLLQGVGPPVTLAIAPIAPTQPDIVYTAEIQPSVTAAQPAVDRDVEPKVALYFSRAQWRLTRNNSADVGVGDIPQAAAVADACRVREELASRAKEMRGHGSEAEGAGDVANASRNSIAAAAAAAAEAIALSDATPHEEVMRYQMVRGAVLNLSVLSNA